MLNTFDILQTIDMLDHQHLDIRTVTMGVNLMDCAHPDIDECARRVYDKICRLAGDLLPVCQGNCIWERICNGMPCHPLKTTIDGYLKLYRACFGEFEGPFVLLAPPLTPQALDGMSWGTGTR